MELYARIIILCLLCVASAAKVPSKNITEFRKGSLAHFQNPSRSPKQEVNGSSKRFADQFRDKRALGLLLSGLAQIFGYTVTPIQIASLPNPNTTKPAAMTGKTMKGQQTASSRPASNTTAPRLQETIRFTGVVNLGNNSDILGHLQRYEQIFHGRRNNMTTTTVTTARPPMPSTNLSLDPRTTKPPLLAPFFVKIPLPIAPNLPPATIPIKDFKLSYPAPLSSDVSDKNEDEEPPVRKEQETVYRNNKDSEQYTVEEKDIYDEKDVRKPSKYTHQLYVDEPALNKKQEDRYNQVQRNQEKHIARLKQQKEQRNRDNDDDREDEINEKHRNREEEIANRNREHASTYEPTEERRPAYNNEENEDSVEYEEREDQANLSKESQEKEREKTEDYPNYDYNDDPNKQFKGYKPIQPEHPANLNKYIGAGYNQQLPIGDYFHEDNPEDIRDSYGEILNNKKLEDDRLSSYFSMFKHPYNGVYDFRGIHNPEDASREREKEETSNGYDEHLARLQKLREEYALPVPENKYEEYDINNESEEDRNNRESERIQNLTSAKSKRPKTSRPHGKENIRPKTTTESTRNQLQRGKSTKSEDTKSQEEIDFVKYTPLVVPIRYIDATDKLEQATTLKYKESDKLAANSQLINNNQFLLGNNVDIAPTVSQEKLIPPINLPGRPQQLQQLEQREQNDYGNLQIWSPPFEYALDNRERTTVLPANPHNYPLKHRINQHKTNNAANNVNDENSEEQPSGYVVVVGNPENPYRYPYNIYYVPNEALNSQNQGHLNTEDTHPQHQFYVPQQNANQQFIQTIRPNLTEHNHNETTNSPHNYYYQPQEVPTDILDRYRYNYAERVHANEPPELRYQIYNTENWSNRIYPPQPREHVLHQSPSDLAKLQNIASSNQNVQNESSEKQAYLQPPRRRKNSFQEDQRKDDRKVKASLHQSIPQNKPFDDPQSAHDFFGFSKNDYSFNGESGDATKVTEENGKITKESQMLVAPEPVAYHHDESLVKHTNEPENDTEKAKVTEYRNKMATLRVSEQRQLTPNGPIHYVDFIRNI